MCCDIEESEAKNLLEITDKRLPVALVMGVAKCPLEKAEECLMKSGGKVRAAIELCRE